MNYLDLLQVQYGIPLWLIITILVWSFVWKLLALWKSARKNHVGWFIVLAILNTVGILEILYIYVFSENDYWNKNTKKSSGKKSSKKKSTSKKKSVKKKSTNKK